MKRRSLPALACVCVALWRACEHGSVPVAPDGSSPVFHGAPCKGPHSNDPGCDDGGSGDGGKTIDVDFGESASSDFQSTLQTIGGSNSKSRIKIDESPFELTVAFSDAVLSTCDAVIGDTRLSDLQALSPVDGLLSGVVDKREPAVGVFFTVQVGGDEYNLITNFGTNSVQETATLTMVTKVGGDMRVRKNGDVPPICTGIVDYEFTVSK